MLADAEIRRELAEIVAARMDVDGDGPAADEAAQVLASYSGLSEDDATALLAAEPVELDLDDYSGLANALYLHEGLLSCLFSPLAPSDELVRHVLREIRSRNLDPECPDCSALANAIDAVCATERPEDWERLALNLLAHVSDSPDGVEDEEDDAFVERLGELTLALPPDLREEVFAFAVFKRKEAEGRSFNDFGALAKLRGSYLSPVARACFDAIATSRDGELTAHELVAQLQLADGRALGQLTRSLARAISDLGRAGLRLPEEPLLVNGRGSSRRFRLAPRTLGIWRALARAAGGEQAVIDSVDWNGLEG